MDQPHAPYLFFMGVGDFAIVKDTYKGKEVSYYVEKEYAPVARKIFGNTPEMMSYFSRILGVEYPWVKYSQIVGRDYVSGAMENTTATLHQESAQQDARELIDGNRWEGTIAHELFHQWFGDLVTTESWSNLTLNESFANYSQVLWEEYKYGKDAGDAENYNDMQGYIQSESDNKDLVRYFYEDKEAVFDAVSYNKGGRILHMLRNHIGDSAFFRALNLYLTTYQYKAAEAHQLRLAFEEITGRDMNWFWNQWYFGAGHPKLTIDYNYDDNAGKAQVIVKQTQAGDKLFKLPVAIDVYENGKKVRHQVWLQNRTDTFTFSYAKRPDLINVDGDKILLAEKRDNKSLQNFVFQYKNAGTYLDRREAIDFAGRNLGDPAAVELLRAAVKDKYAGLRNLTLSKIDLRREALKAAMEPLIADLAKNDPKSTVRSVALTMLSSYNKPEYKQLFMQNLNDSSYSVAGSALEGLMKYDSAIAVNTAKKLSSQPAKGKLVESITKVLIRSGDEGSFDIIAGAFDKMPLSQAKFNMLVPFTDLLGSIQSTENVKKGIDMIVKFRNSIPEQYGLTPVVNNFMKGIITKKEAAKSTAVDKTSLQAQIDYINSKIAEEKKAF
jgi:aminopeptidase N